MHKLHSRHTDLWDMQNSEFEKLQEESFYDVTTFVSLTSNCSHNKDL